MQILVYRHAMNPGKTRADVGIHVRIQVPDKIADVGNRLDFLNHRITILEFLLTLFTLGKILQQPDRTGYLADIVVNNDPNFLDVSNLSVST